MTTTVSAPSVPMLSVMLAALAVPLSAQTPDSPLLTAEALACAPRLAPEESAPRGLVLDAPDVPLRLLFGPGDPVLVSVGRAEGVSVGTQFFTQREQSSPDPAAPSSAIRVRLTSGWLRVVEVDEHHPQPHRRAHFPQPRPLPAHAALGKPFLARNGDAVAGVVVGPVVEQAGPVLGVAVRLAQHLG